MLVRGSPEGGRYSSAHIDFTIGNVGTARYPGFLYRGSLFVGLGAEQFAVWYDMLRSERPVRLNYAPDTEAGSGPTQLDWLILALTSGGSVMESAGNAPSPLGQAEWRTDDIGHLG